MTATPQDTQKFIILKITGNLALWLSLRKIKKNILFGLQEFYLSETTNTAINTVIWDFTI